MTNLYLQRKEGAYKEICFWQSIRAGFKEIEDFKLFVEQLRAIVEISIYEAQDHGSVTRQMVILSALDALHSCIVSARIEISKTLSDRKEEK